MSKTDEFYTGLMGGKPYESPCEICGARERTATGQDPCIENLPGVLHACCGHGRREAYVAFENGMVVRGAFDFNPVHRKKLLAANQRFLT